MLKRYNMYKLFLKKEVFCYEGKISENDIDCFISKIERLPMIHNFMSREDYARMWADLLIVSPENHEKCCFAKFLHWDWVRLLCVRPEFAEKCTFENFTAHDWKHLLKYQPKLASCKPAEKIKSTYEHKAAKAKKEAVYEEKKQDAIKEMRRRYFLTLNILSPFTHKSIPDSLMLDDQYDNYAIYADILGEKVPITDNTAKNLKSAKTRSLTHYESVEGYPQLFIPTPFFDTFAAVSPSVPNSSEFFDTPMKAICSFVGAEKNYIDLWDVSKKNKIDILCRCRSESGEFSLKNIFLVFESQYMHPEKSLFYDKRCINKLKEYAAVSAVCGGGKAYLTATINAGGRIISIRHFKCTYRNGIFKLTYKKNEE